MRNNPKFKVLGIEHVAIAVNDLEKPGQIFNSILGIEHSGSEEITEQKVITDIFDTSAGKIELLKATSEKSPISKFLQNRGEGIHHIAFRVDDILAALQHCKDEGIRLIDDAPRIGAEGLQIAFLHPKSTNGVLIELCQR